MILSEMKVKHEQTFKVNSTVSEGFSCTVWLMINSSVSDS